mmetsp:Transcript_5996/g.8117  ORF Transcript_5996/g.8117 Transcript_5996/m.8117 type:complete len:158 (-) Transcript_5996:547-1020(-)
MFSGKFIDVYPFTDQPAWTLKMLLPSGSANYFAIDSGSYFKYYSDAFTNEYGVRKGNNIFFRSVMRGLVTKMPGFQYFSGLNISLLRLTGVISNDQYREIMQWAFDGDQKMKWRYYNSIEAYQFVDDIPKSQLFVRLNDNVTDEQRNFVTNGIRNFF